MSTLTPQTSSQKLLTMLLLLPLLHPSTLLHIRNDLERQPTAIHRQPERIGNHHHRQLRQRRGRDRIHREHRKQAEAHPRGLGDEGQRERCGPPANAVEAAVAAVGADAREQERAEPRRPRRHRRRQHHLPPIPRRGARRASEEGGPRRERGARGARGRAGTQHRQVQAQSRAGEVRERAAEVVEALGLEGDAWDCDGRLDAVGEADAGDDCAQEVRSEIGGLENGV